MGLVGGLVQPQERFHPAHSLWSSTGLNLLENFDHSPCNSGPLFGFGVVTALPA